jgi:hypothetical protein
VATTAMGLRPITRDRLITREMNDHLTRYMVPMMRPEPELFIDHEAIKELRRCRCCAFEVYESGAGQGGIAAYIGGAKTMKQALEITNLRTGRIAR